MDMSVFIKFRVGVSYLSSKGIKKEYTIYNNTNCKTTVQTDEESSWVLLGSLATATMTQKIP